MIRTFTFNTWILGRKKFWHRSTSGSGKKLTHTPTGILHFICLHYWRKSKTLLNSLRMDQVFYKTGSRSVPKFPTMHCVLGNLGSTFWNVIVMCILIVRHDLQLLKMCVSVMSCLVLLCHVTHVLSWYGLGWCLLCLFWFWLFCFSFFVFVLCDVVSFHVMACVVFLSCPVFCSLEITYPIRWRH